MKLWLVRKVQTVEMLRQTNCQEWFLFAADEHDIPLKKKPQQTWSFKGSMSYFFDQHFLPQPMKPLQSGSWHNCVYKDTFVNFLLTKAGLQWTNKPGIKNNLWPTLNMKLIQQTPLTFKYKGEMNVRWK